MTPNVLLIFLSLLSQKLETRTDVSKKTKQNTMEDIEDLGKCVILVDDDDDDDRMDRLDTFRCSLLKWYDLNRRKLPWRGDEETTGVADVLSPKKVQVNKSSTEKNNRQQRRVEPYGTWVSEIMCQQTRVETVVAYYQRWMKRFPDIATLSTASDEEVNKAWVGLGYYRRARLLRDGAKYVMENHAGKVPSTVEELLKIPGIGPYTAGAIASIAFARYSPLVDGNVIRVLSRLRALAGNSNAVKKKCWSVAENLVSKTDSFFRPGDFNQALMELGATVCSPKNPKCEICPVRSHCRAYAEVHEPSKASKVFNFTSNETELELARKRASTVEKYPLPTIKAKPRPQNRVVAVIQHEGMVLLRRRPKSGLLAGQWEFPALTVEENDEKKEKLSKPEDKVREQACNEILASRKILRRESVGLVTHTFSHLKHFMYVDVVYVSAKEDNNDDVTEREEKWCDLKKLCVQTRKSPDFVPLTKGMQKVLKAITKHGTSKKRKGMKMGFWKKWCDGGDVVTKKRKKEGKLL